jgi:hypothetical protein
VAEAAATPSVAVACPRKRRRKLASAVRRSRNVDRKLLRLESAERRRSVVLRQAPSSLRSIQFLSADSGFFDRRGSRTTC